MVMFPSSVLGTAAALDGGRQIAKDFPWLEANGAAGRDRKRLSRARVSPDPALACLYDEDAEATELDAPALQEPRLQRIEDDGDAVLGLDYCHPGLVRDVRGDVGLDHRGDYHLRSRFAVDSISGMRSTSPNWTGRWSTSEAAGHLGAGSVFHPRRSSAGHAGSIVGTRLSVSLLTSARPSEARVGCGPAYAQEARDSRMAFPTCLGAKSVPSGARGGRQRISRSLSACG